jgi:hypothetical protein
MTKRKDKKRTLREYTSGEDSEIQSKETPEKTPALEQDPREYEEAEEDRKAAA